jgi:hypothetical protein
MSYSRTQQQTTRDSARPLQAVGCVTRSQKARRDAEFRERWMARQAVQQSVLQRPVVQTPVVVVQTPVAQQPVVVVQKPVVHQTTRDSVRPSPAVGCVTRSQTARRNAEFRERWMAREALQQRIVQKPLIQTPVVVVQKPVVQQPVVQPATESIPRKYPTRRNVTNHNDEELFKFVRTYENRRGNFITRMRETGVVYKFYELPRDVRLRSTPLLNREIIGHFTYPKTNNMRIRRIGKTDLIALCVLAKNENGMYIHQPRILESMPYPRNERIYLIVPQLPGITISEQIYSEPV